MASSNITLYNFVGQSSFSQDFQQVLERSVQRQSLQLLQLQSQQTAVSDKSQALLSLDNIFYQLQSAATGIASAFGASSYAATVADPSIAQVLIAEGATTGTYSLEVLSTGSRTQTVSSAGLGTVTNPATQNISAESSFTLTIDGVSKTITPGTNSLQGLVNTINADSSLSVSASIVNVGSSGSPDYRLSLQATKLGNVSIQLDDGTSPLLDTIATGTFASYKVNGLPGVITSDSENITLSPGVTVKLLKESTPGVPTTITIQQSSTSVEDALKTFVTAYNSAVDELAKSHGPNAGPLAGDSILFTLRNTLRTITSYENGSGPIGNLPSLGLQLDSTGHMQFNTATFRSVTNGNLTVLQQFLGDLGSGFVKAADTALQTIENPTTGFLKTQQNIFSQRIRDLGRAIDSETDKINEFQQNLLQQLSRADALIAQLESQANFFKGLLDYNNQNK